MPPKPHPFPLALNIGTDIVHLPRIARLVSRPNGYLTRFTRRILHDSEQADFRARFGLASGSDVPLESRLYPTHRRFHQGLGDQGQGQGQGQGLGAGLGLGNTNTNANGEGEAGGGPGIPSGTPASPPNPTQPQTVNPEMARWLAGRFAAKEAARKAAPGGAATVGWKDVIVTRGEGNAETNASPHILSSLPANPNISSRSAGEEAAVTAAAAAAGQPEAPGVVMEDEPASEKDGGEGAGLEISGGRRWRRSGGRANRSKDSGRPDIVYLDPQGGPGRMGKLSISHDGEYVVAMVLAAG